MPVAQAVGNDFFIMMSTVLVFEAPSHKDALCACPSWKHRTSFRLPNAPRGIRGRGEEALVPVRPRGIRGRGEEALLSGALSKTRQSGAVTLPAPSNWALTPVTSYLVEILRLTDKRANLPPSHCTLRTRPRVSRTSSA